MTETRERIEGLLADSPDPGAFTAWMSRVSAAVLDLLGDRERLTTDNARLVGFLRQWHIDPETGAKQADDEVVEPEIVDEDKGRDLRDALDLRATDLSGLLNAHSGVASTTVRKSFVHPVFGVEVVFGATQLVLTLSDKSTMINVGGFVIEFEGDTPGSDIVEAVVSHILANQALSQVATKG